MGGAKRLLEAYESDFSGELQICIKCEEQIEVEGAETESWEHFTDGLDLTTIWYCGCNGPASDDCVRCEAEETIEAIPVCQDCVDRYRGLTESAYEKMHCGRCDGAIPVSEIGIFRESGYCGWCSHMVGRAMEVEDVNSWSPETKLPLTEKKIITPAEFASNLHALIADPRLLQYFSNNPREIFSLTPRQFEEFVSELLRNFGYDVTLGPKGADGGVDIFARQDLVSGPELVLVQCKLYKPTNKVSEPTVKQLSADVSHRDASRGLVVTTSTFTKPALGFIEQYKYRLAGTDWDKLLEWIGKLCPK